MTLSVYLRVGDTTAQDINLQASGINIMEYEMQSPEMAQNSIQDLADGDSLSIPTWSNVSEILHLFFSGTPEEISADIQAVERVLLVVREGSVGWLDDKLWLLVEFDSDTEYWRSQILTAQLVHDRAPEEYWLGHVNSELRITRRYYFETVAVYTPFMISTATVSPSASGVIIHNNDDAVVGQRNWFQIAASEALGSIPAPLKISLQNISGATRAGAAFYFGNYVWNNPTTVDPILTAANATEVDSSWTGMGENSVYVWSLSGENLTASFKGGFGRPVVVFANRPDDLTLVRGKLQYRQPAPTLDIAVGEWVLNGTSYVRDLGGIPIPPGGTWQNMGAFMALVLSAKAATSAGDTATVDWIQIMPSGPGRYHVIRAISSSWLIPDTDFAISDGPERSAYANESGNNVPGYIPFFDPIHVWPDRINRIAVIIEGSNFTGMETGFAWEVTVSYRPRRLTI